MYESMNLLFWAPKSFYGVALGNQRGTHLEITIGLLSYSESFYLGEILIATQLNNTKRVKDN